MREDNIRYESMYRTLRMQIYSGVIRRGACLPAQQALCRQFHVGITTVRRVIRMLEADGLITCASGSRARVCADRDDAACAAALLQRADSIKDILAGLACIMPALYAHSALCGADFSGMADRIGQIRPDMHPADVYRLGTACFSTLLVPFQNAVLLDLQSDLAQYAHIPDLPFTGLADPFAVPTQEARDFLSRLHDRLVHRQTEALAGQLRGMYAWMDRQADAYFAGLRQQYPCGAAALPYQWFAAKGRAHLYTLVARSLYRRLDAGEFAGRTYLPSVPEIMQTYTVSKSTASAAVALLSDIGMVRTIDKKGIVPLAGGEKAPLRLAWGVIAEHLVLFLDALQILALCAEPMARAACGAMPRAQKQALSAAWAREADTASGTRVILLLLDFLERYVPQDCLKCILSQFDNLLIWGHYLTRVGEISEEFLVLEAEIRAQFQSLCVTWQSGDDPACARMIALIFHKMFYIAREHLARCETVSLPLPAPLPQSVGV